MADCQTVDIQEPTPDTSELRVSITSLNSPSPETITLEVRANNSVTSGNGETLTQDIIISLNGTSVTNTTAQLSPGETDTQSFEFTDTPTGSVPVQVESNDDADQGNVTVSDPVPDESEVSVLLESANSPAANELDATATIANEIVSGNGEWLGVELALTVDGNTVDTVGYDLQPGESRTHTFNVSGLNSGSSQVCAEANVLNRS